MLHWHDDTILEMYILRIFNALISLSFVTSPSQAQFSELFRKINVSRGTIELYKELFDDVLPANLIAVPSSNHLSDFISKMEKLQRRDAKENQLDAYQKANLKFWMDSLTNRAVKCDPKFDDKLLTRYQQHAFRVLPPGSNDNINREFEHFVGLIRNRYLALCEIKMTESINGTSVNQILSFREQLKREPNIEQPVDDTLKLVMSNSKCSTRIGCIQWKRKPMTTAPVKFEKTYADKVVNPCMRITSSRWMGRGLMEYLLRFKPVDMLSDQVRYWYRYSEWCEKFVDSKSKQNMWEDVYTRLAVEDACLVSCINDRD